MGTIFDLCIPRADVMEGRVKDEEFAADLASVVSGTAPDEYRKPEVFFSHTHPTRGLRTLLETVCRRLSGVGGEVNSVIRLDTQYGGGKTHSLIALTHAVRGMKGVKKPEEFVDPKLLPKGKVRVAALDGENSDPANGLKLETGLLAHSLWGQMAYQLAGKAGFERVRKSDETHTAPGDKTIVELFGGEPTLILLDEVSVYLRKVARVFPNAAEQFTAFMQALLKAVASTPNVAMVFTLAIRSDNKKATDAYKAEHEIVLTAFEEAESIVSRKSTQLNPTEEDETVDVLRRRLFDRVDRDSADEVIGQYFSLWDRNKEHLPSEAFSPETRDQFRHGYPFHPETLSLLIEKTSSLSTFQRTRGMLRLLARTIHQLWKVRPIDALAIHPHHIDPGFGQIRDEITTRLGQGAFTPALASDVASVPGRDPSIAQRLDQENYAGQPPVTSYVARTIFLHTLAYPEDVQGVKPDQLRFSVCCPVIEPTFVEAARKRFAEDSLYLDDRPGAPMRFRVEPNLTQFINRATRDVDPDDLRSYLNERIKDLFQGKGHGFEMVPFPAGPYEVPDEIGSGRPYLVVLNCEAFTVSESPSQLPAELVRMATRKGVQEELRSLRNNLVFVVADDRQLRDMRLTSRRRLGLQAIVNSDRIQDLAEYQQRRVREEYEKSGSAVAIAILQCYRHLFYPSHAPLAGSDAQLGHTVIELQNASDSPGNGQVHIRRALQEQKKLLMSGDPPDAPAYVRDQTPLKTKGQITTVELRNEFRKAPKLSILMDDDPLIRCVRVGIDTNVFIYRKGDLVWGKGDPAPSIEISENAFVHTIANAAEAGLWPRKPKEKTTDGTDTGDTGGDATGGGGGTGGTGGGETTTTTEPTLSAEGPLKLALTRLFEAARKGEVKALASVTIRVYEYKAAWDLHQATATFRDADVSCWFDTTIGADGIDEFMVQFRGSMAKANPVKSFLDAQLRASTEQTFTGDYILAFAKPLGTDSVTAEGFIKSMTKYGGGEAYVEARAAAEEK
ncbi:MAG: ATP-binding protein [Phycisphaerae bacterium]|nr:ATP-binding protein [Phycisphaerae bacterium]